MEWFEYCVDDEGTMGVMLVGADEAVCGVGASLCNARFRGKGLRCSGNPGLSRVCAASGEARRVPSSAVLLTLNENRI